MQRTQLERETAWLLREKHKGKRTPAFLMDEERLQKGEPLDYLIGFVEFAGCRIDLSERPFIPRPETEHWTLKAIADLSYNLNICSNYETARKNHAIRCLDLFAGSGCVGVAVLKHMPTAHVDFAEKEPRFLKQIRINATLNRINPRRYRIIESDVFQSKNRTMERSMGLYDYIFANPPYIAKSRRRRVQSSVLKYEPREALFAGEDGLKYIRRFLKEAKRHLNPGGRIYLEFDSPQKRAIEKLLSQFGYAAWQFRKDQFGKWRFAQGGNMRYTARKFLYETCNS
ncbi:MAG: hypothetical protein A2672_02850 [Candidatus Wildermuthbacteria bacterium RIFCSPHIGHO2_01_FULL_49_22b]|uniref:peptide chain release factor N(5)-glutamine methyltransferase n=1 Tax=Candidatus Wildermuthbacteria bacterium RIFCSPHIGHO2_01_FULL_49_22b TaxID=1802448 RepID=A0A1G2QVT7_9BACT|nr:MAG: hypothetical protein A2672_02850 [Candidatus Wildermuthbacteria bacterium RIFCSPHIGHO2_01_FULL_49_22b]